MEKKNHNFVHTSCVYISIYIFLAFGSVCVHRKLKSVYMRKSIVWASTRERRQKRTNERNFLLFFLFASQQKRRKQSEFYECVSRKHLLSLRSLYWGAAMRVSNDDNDDDSSKENYWRKMKCFDTMHEKSFPTSNEIPKQKHIFFSILSCCAQHKIV